MGRTSTEVKNRWNRKSYDYITLTVQKGEREQIQAAAAAVGKSTNSYIRELIYQNMGGGGLNGSANWK